MLEIKDIRWRAQDGPEIVKGVTLTIPDGQLVAITGPNGGGKTTLAKLIAGIEMPASGSIWLNGEDITRLDVTERAKRGISYAFQQPVRFKGLTVRDLIELASGGDMTESALCEILAKVGLCAREYIDREVNQSLSGGEIKRIEIATALARHTRVTVFDEPEAGIDLWSFSSLIGVFEQMRGQIDGSLIIISHQERILSIADTIVVLSDGVVSQSGPRDTVLPRLLGRIPACACPKREGVCV